MSIRHQVTISRLLQNFKLKDEFLPDELELEKLLEVELLRASVDDFFMRRR